jgi:high affinity Mn2+ porin
VGKAPIRSGKLLLLSLVSGVAYGAPDVTNAPPSEAEPTAQETNDRFSFFWQSTYVEQETMGFRAPYSGPNSLTPNSGRETVDLTLFAGTRLWSGAELWINPEIDQGFGLDDTLGVAGFPSAEAYKVGHNQPYFRLPRAFVRDSIDLGGGTNTVAAAPNQLAGTRSDNRLVVTVGKFSVVDIFDTNHYAHDARGDFLNWSVVDAGSFDYAADAWGYTVGAAVEWYVGSWTFRAGVFDLSDIPNSKRLDPGFHEFQMDWEIERRYELGGMQGRVMLTAFDSRGRMGLLDEAVDIAEATDTPVNIAAVRSYRSRLGASLDLEQPLSNTLGMFIRAGKAQGNVEPYEFADIDRTVATGLSLQGSAWSRPHDTVGLAGVLNGISGARERYLNAGGLGILVGDGKLPDPGPEKILETYYDAAVFRGFQLTLDYQYVTNPAYNRDRGPVSIFAVRAHLQF